MIIEYNNIYDNQIKNLFVELQEYIASIDKEGYNILTPGYGEKYLKKTLNEIQSNNGKMFLFKENDKIVGLIVGLISDEVFEYDFHAPKRGRITELIVTKACRTNGYGKALLIKMENFFKEQGCKNIILEVFGYNEHAIAFYERNGYHTRLLDVTKNT